MRTSLLIRKRAISCHAENCFGCCNKNTINWMTNKQHLFLIVLESGKLNIKMPTDSVSEKHPFLLDVPSHWILTYQRAKLPQAPFIGTLIPFMRVQPSP